MSLVPPPKLRQLADATDPALETKLCPQRSFMSWIARDLFINTTVRANLWIANVVMRELVFHFAVNAIEAANDLPICCVAAIRVMQNVVRNIDFFLFVTHVDFIVGVVEIRLEDVPHVVAESALDLFRVV